MLTGEYNLLSDHMVITNIIAAVLFVLPIAFVFLDKKWLIGLYAVSIVANLPLVFSMRFGFSYELIIALALIVKLGLTAYKEKTLLYNTTRENICLIGSLLIVVIVNLLTSFFHFNREAYVARILVYAVNFFILIIFTYFLKTKDTIESFRIAFVIGGVILVVSAIAEMIYGYYVFGVSNLRPAGLLLDPNVCAFALNITLIISFYKPRQQSLLTMVFLIVARLVILFGVFLTVSRSGYIGTLIVLLYMLFYYSRTDENWIAAATVGAFAVAYFVFSHALARFWVTMHGIIDLDRIFPFPGPTGGTGGGGPVTPTPGFASGERIMLAMTALRVFAQNLFTGVGIGNVLPEIASYTGVGLESHNFILQMLAESGTLMIVALLLLAYCLLRLIGRSIRRIRWFFVLLVVVVSVESVFNHNLLNLNLVWLALAFALALNTLHSRQRIEFGIARRRKG